MQLVKRVVNIKSAFLLLPVHEADVLFVLHCSYSIIFDAVNFIFFSFISCFQIFLHLVTITSKNILECQLGSVSHMVDWLIANIVNKSYYYSLGYCIF